MISVLVPVYNFDIRSLIADLVQQIKLTTTAVEIIVMDDLSNDHFKNLNSSISSIKEIKYISSEVNLGRNAIRQKMAAIASFENILFIDCDSKIINDQYLKKYTDQIKNGYSVVVGGRIYDAQKPFSCEKALHWKYGTYRESQPYQKRMRCPHRNFMTNNFLIKKEIFCSLKYDDNIKTYGHEDTYVGMQLEEKSIPVIHIDNPIIHLGVEYREIFIKKSLEALKNIYYLETILPKNQLNKHIKLYRYYAILKSLHLLKIYKLIYISLKNIIRKNLHSCNPNLVYYDFYRLNHYIDLHAS